MKIHKDSSVMRIKDIRGQEKAQKYQKIDLFLDSIYYLLWVGGILLV